MAPSRPDHFVFAKALRYRVLEGPGVTDPVTRKAAAERASGGPAIEASYDDLVRQIGELSHRVTSAQVEQLVREVGSEKAAFEVIVAANLKCLHPITLASIAVTFHAQAVIRGPGHDRDARREKMHPLSRRHSAAHT
jgi:hypothetical protein